MVVGDRKIEVQHHMTKSSSIYLSYNPTTATFNYLHTGKCRKLTQKKLLGERDTMTKDKE
jgi:hypothetical protein